MLELLQILHSLNIDMKRDLSLTPRGYKRPFHTVISQMPGGIVISISYELGKVYGPSTWFKK